MKITYFVHSTSTDNESGIRSGWSDPPLSVTGETQALSLREDCAGLAVDAVYSSDLKRAVETVRTAFRYDIVFDRRLREMNYGVLNGYPDAAFPQDEFACIETRFESGENCQDVERRIREFLRDRHQQHVRSNIAVMGHQYPQLAFEVICNGATWQEAVRNDWRKIGRWQPGWVYRLPNGFE